MSNIALVEVNTKKAAPNHDVRGGLFIDAWHALQPDNIVYGI